VLDSIEPMRSGLGSRPLIVIFEAVVSKTVLMYCSPFDSQLKILYNG